MRFRVVKLNFTAPVHLGQLGIALERTEDFAHSDTLFSGIVNNWARVFGREDTEDLLTRFTQEEPPFLLSSGFVFDKDKYFLPRPIGALHGFDEEYRKELKKTPFLPLDLFEKWINGQVISLGDLQQARKSHDAISENYVVPRVQLDRINAASNIWYCGLTKFEEGCGLFILIDFREETLEDKLKIVFEAFGDCGLGGEKTYGNGAFEPQWDGVDIKTPGDGEFLITLSLLCPKTPEVESLLEQSQYGLIERRGWIDSPFTKDQLKKKSVNMFTEGSVFKNKPNSTYLGRLVDVTPDGFETHRVYRYGIGLTLPIRGG